MKEVIEVVGSIALIFAVYFTVKYVVLRFRLMVDLRNAKKEELRIEGLQKIVKHFNRSTPNKKVVDEAVTAIKPVTKKRYPRKKKTTTKVQE